MGEEFKSCKICHHVWPDQESFLSDPDVTLVGYQVNFVSLEEGLFLFNHSCGTTMSLWASEFMNLSDGPIAAERLTDSEHCLGRCPNKEDLEPCDGRCECPRANEGPIAIEKGQYSGRAAGGKSWQLRLHHAIMAALRLG